MRRDRGVRLARDPKASTTAVFAGRLTSGRGELEPAGQHGVDRDPVAIEVEQDELAPSPDTAELLPNQARELGRRAAHGEWRGRLGPHDGSTGQRGVEGVRHDRQIGQLGHGAAIVGACGSVLDSAGPSGRNSRTASLIPNSTSKERTAGLPSYGPLDRRPTA